MWFFVGRNLVIDGYQVSVMNKVIQVVELGRLRVITPAVRMWTRYGPCLLDKEDNYSR